MTGPWAGLEDVSQRRVVDASNIGELRSDRCQNSAAVPNIGCDILEIAQGQHTGAHIGQKQSDRSLLI